MAEVSASVFTVHAAVPRRNLMTVTSPECQTREPGWIRGSQGLIVGVLLVGGAAAVCASFIPFEILATRVRGMSASGVAPFFNQDFYSAMQLRLRLMGAVNIIAAVLAFLARRRMEESGQRIARDFSRLGRHGRVSLRSMPFADWIGLGLLVFLASALRRSYLFDPMRYDEAYTFLQYSSRPFYAALSFYNAPNNHLFHTLLVRVAYLMFGSDPWALRIPVFVGGVLLVPAAYVAARSLYREGTGLLAAALVTSSSILIEYSTNARGYMILCLEFVLLIAVAVYAARNDNWAAWVLAGVVAGMGFYTIPIMLYPVGGVAAWLLLSTLAGDTNPNARGTIVGLMLALAIAAILSFELYTPVFAVSGPKAVFSNKWVVASPFRIFLHGLGPSLASTWRDWNRDLPPVISWALIAGFLVGLLAHRRCSKFRIPLLLGLILWVVPLLFFQRVVPFERVWLFALPLYFIMAAAGLELILRPLFERMRLPYAMMLFALAIALYTGFRVEQVGSVALLNHGRGMEALTGFLKSQIKPGDSLIVALPSDYPLFYYFHKQGLSSSYLTSRGPGRTFIVVNGVTGDTVTSVLEQAGASQTSAAAATLVGRFDSASLYEIAPSEER